MAIWSSPRFFLRNVNNVIKSRENKAWLERSLFAVGDVRLVVSSIGQFAPGQVGGPNATQGFEGQSLINPWDFILMMEGVVLLGGAVSRKLEVRRDPKAAFPFTVRSSATGHGSLSFGDEAGSRGELSAAALEPQRCHSANWRRSSPKDAQSWVGDRVGLESTLRALSLVSGWTEASRVSPARGS